MKDARTQDLLRFAARFAKRVKAAYLPVYLLLPLALTAPLPAEDEPRSLVDIDNLDTGDFQSSGFRLNTAQVVRVKAVDLEARGHGGELTSAWILDAKSRRVVWTMGDSKPKRKSRGLRFYDDVLDLRAGVYEAYFATYADDWEPTGQEEVSDEIRRLWRRIRLQAVGWEDYDTAVEDLLLEVRGNGRPLDEDEMEGERRQLRRDALIALQAHEDDATLKGAFVLDEAAVVDIYALGEASEKGVFDYGWIIDLDDRNKLWKLTYEASRWGGGSRRNRLVRKTVELPAGRYEAYFVTDDTHSPEDWSFLPPKDPAFWGLTIWPREKGRTLARTVQPDLPKRPIVELTRLGNDEERTILIRVGAPQKVRIYAVGEGFPSGMADTGKIVDARSQEVVWAMAYARTSHAGGGNKNRLTDEVIQLQKGAYLVSFQTDDSHAFSSWNTKAPVYPERWGISLYSAGEVNPLAIQVGWEGLPEVGRIDQVRSSEYRRQSFRLEKETILLINALAEITGGTIYDHGWIEDENGDKVWMMPLKGTRHAGGARKNRAFRGTISLPAGNYVLAYRSDESHDFSGWNEPAPTQPDAWGIRLNAIE